MIAQAKATFGAAALLIAISVTIGVWWFAGNFYAERIAVLQNTIDYQKIQIADLKQTAPEAPKTAGAQIAVLGVNYHDAKESGDIKRPYFNFAFVNLGRTPARGAGAYGFLKITEKPLSAAEENEIMTKIQEDAHFENPKHATNELSFMEYQYITVYTKDKYDDLKLNDVLSGKSYMYGFFIIQFTDNTQAKDEKYIIERCAIFYKSLTATGVCHGHNQIYSEKIQ